MTIMPKGQITKLKGSICNMPIESGSVCSVLPRDIDSSGVVFFQLKRKLSHKFPVISEPVRPEKINSILEFPVENNHLYENIIILPNSNSESIDFHVDSSDKIINTDTNENNLNSTTENLESEF